MLVEKIAVQFDEKYLIAIPSLMVEIRNGVNVFDTNLAETDKVMKNGVPYDVSTEEVLHMCPLLDIQTGVDPQKLIEVGHNMLK